MVSRAALACLLLTAGLVSCDRGSPRKGETVMRDMEVIDGTANDAMTDLDNVAVEGTAVADDAPEAANASRAVPTTEPPGPANAAANDAAAPDAPL